MFQKKGKGNWIKEVKNAFLSVIVKNPRLINCTIPFPRKKLFQDMLNSLNIEHGMIKVIKQIEIKCLHMHSNQVKKKSGTTKKITSMAISSS